eukprot:CAMPEP_0174971782 /NCGR_PEP_ID=MMETSP0004_2-20121128/10222_1 /TAXON_ID=420556 /ORGANISM="Ochromonas sp., Strain CCMP1393" /LENGTH=215 /DNA_ID=CAMNT_0016221847 /DNA_START=77 /DNA_END=724 /DNA_ORIENTATION=+
MGARASKTNPSSHPGLKEGDKVPNVVIKARIRIAASEDHASFEWRDIMTEDLFGNKRVVIFSIPGAFTPVCSCDHMPSYQRLYDEMLALGVDEVFCVSVNDAFVMRQWGLMQGLKEEKEKNNHPLNPGNFHTIKLIPDGAAKFTRAMGMTCKWENIGGFGERSWRYSAVFNNMKIEKLFLEEDGNIEDDAAHGPEPLEVSDGSTMMNYLKETQKK